jgi:hypothetical protein
MSTTDRTAATKRAPMDSMRKTALVAGVLYLITFLASIPAVFLMGPVLTDPNYVVSATGADTQVSFGALLDLVTALAGIGTAVALFSVVKRQHEGLALGFVTTRMFEAAAIAVGVFSVLSVVTLRQPGATGVEATSLVITGQALVAIKNWTFIIGPGMAGMNALMLATLMYRSRLVPRIIPALGLIGAPIYLSGQIGIILGINDAVSAWSAIGLPGIFFWELSLGLWMTFKGFNRSAPIMLAAAAEAEAGRPQESPTPVGSRGTVATSPGAA